MGGYFVGMERVSDRNTKEHQKRQRIVHTVGDRALPLSILKLYFVDFAHHFKF